MSKRRICKQWIRITLLISILFGGWGDYFPLPEVQAAAPNYHGIKVGKIDSNKVVGPISQITQISIFSINATLGATVADIEVDGSKDAQQVLHFADLDKKADRGWYFVDYYESMYWINRFGGNPGYILSGGAANVYSSMVSALNDFEFVPYQAYNLAELATASGGAGFTIGDNLVRDGDGYKSVGHFRTTPRPVGSVGAPKTKYEVNETVPITATGTDYSYYDRGIIVWNMSVVNKTTGGGYRQFLSNKTIRDESGYVPIVNETSNPKEFTWSETFHYVPTEPGLYEVTLVITDRHHRPRQGSPSDSESAPYTFQFTVGEVTPPSEPNPDPDPQPEPGPACSTDKSRTTMDFQVVGDKIKDYSKVASGGSSIPVEPYADISLRAAKEGVFRMNNIELKPYKNDRTRAEGSFPGSGIVTITYLSDDGKDCWEKTFYVDDGQGREEISCPKITVNWNNLNSGSTLEVWPGETVKIRATYIDKSNETDDALLFYIVTKPDGGEWRSGEYDSDKWKERPIKNLELPFYAQGKKMPKPDPHDLELERGKSYKVRIDYKNTLWEKRTDCEGWEITIIVRDTVCTEDDMKRIRFYRYGTLPNPYPPGGELYGTTRPIYINMFTRLADGTYDTNMALAADVAGTWYLNEDGQRTALTGKLASMERFQLILPSYTGAGDIITLEFISDTGCIRIIEFEILTNDVCDVKTLSNVYLKVDTVDKTYWSREVKIGEIVHLDPEEIHYNTGINFGDAILLYTKGMRTDLKVYWLNPETQDWERKRNGKTLYDSDNKSTHKVQFPTDPDTGAILEGMYRISLNNVDDEEIPQCDGDIFIEIGNPADAENLLIIKDSFSITPKDPQEPGTEATITFEVKNAGKTAHDTKLAVRWESSDKATILDVKAFQPGEVRKITIETIYPQQSEDFIANINPDKDKPANESIWTDNRATWPVEVEGDVPPPPGGGGNFDGGEIGLEIYDSDGRQLQKLEVNADGVWEREPARIRVMIDQTKINEGFQRTEEEINAKISEYKQQLAEQAAGKGRRNLQVTATPEQIVNVKSMAVYQPAALLLEVTGPGIPQQWAVSSASAGGDYLYTGTVVPTQTTWRSVLNPQPYVAKIDGFVISIDYEVVFEVSYEACRSGEEEELCEQEGFSRTMTGRYTITVQGSQRRFEVFEPNAAGSIHHTAEWAEYHARDRYPDSGPNDFYAGERILAQVELQPRHRHPVSGKFPQLEAAEAWIWENGRQQTLLQSRLSLKPSGENRWRGPSYQASKLGTREQGVDTPLMGDKQRGFQKDASYAVYFNVRFRFGVEKGFPYPNKLAGAGHEPGDYRVPFRIIANAWERQGIRNHATQ